MITFRTVFRFNSLLVLLLGVLILLTQSSGWEVSDLFFNPFFSPKPSVALLTRTFQILCAVPVVVCTFSYGLLERIQPRRPENGFILFSALITGAFLLNEIYRIHLYLVRLGVPKLGVSFLYALLLISYAWGFRQQLQSTPYRVLLGGLALLFFAIAIDALKLKNHLLATLLEGIPKLLSEFNISFYYWCVCRYLVEGSLWKTQRKIR